MRAFLKIMVFAVIASSVPLKAAEIISYTYDAKGRLIKVVRSGSVSNGIITDYAHDNPGNRIQVNVAGANQ
jgi:hypothetical protein